MEFDLAGTLLRSFKTAFGSASYFCLFTEKVADPGPGPAIIASVVDIWQGVYGDNSGVVVLPGHGGPQPAGPWQRRGLEIWHDLTAANRELLTAYAVIQTAGLLANNATSQRIIAEVRKSLSADVLLVLDANAEGLSIRK